MYGARTTKACISASDPWTELQSPVCERVNHIGISPETEALSVPLPPSLGRKTAEGDKQSCRGMEAKILLA